ncbi:MAG TPA: bifunctional 5,10-methylenetetrahydrofolate dehydrogenase/5,10-methenyltetrahydrofolate cyclohydrolase [Ktedonobacterales bacterium]|jgi:methylenetetrahydrofolate dehydrogenase (NADP+)/methenyltetrahydrofolate cyclohydrolase|nr:bifunctional 5,10-methylenetetrahydrofolate dehydrogenase/5,10-methenyltetrahydrofolate cyclohydrolase [Ktedonobacterales bacterium]
MPATLLDGRAIAKVVREELRALAEDYVGRHGHIAGLAIICVGARPSSDVYVRQLLREAEQIGVRATLVTLAEDIQDAALRAGIEALNDDDETQGLLVQMPLPPHLSPRTVAEAVSPRKDVDGISMRSAGNLFLRYPSFVPATCAAVVELLDRYQVTLAGRRVVIVGASNTVGKPLAFMLLARDATVTVCHIYTRDLAYWTRQADVVIAAAGKAGLLRADMIQPGATVVDVGINVLEDGGIVGDVAFDDVAAVAGAISPVPGGVGPLTPLMALKQMLLTSGI